MNQKIYIYPKVERTGLCNMLFCWARAEVFAKKNNLPILAPQWTIINRVGTFSRFEKDKRFYFNLFQNTGYVTGFKRQWVLLTKKQVKEDLFLGDNEENLLKKINFTKNGIVLVVTEIKDFFSSFIEEQPYIKKRLHAISNPKIINALSLDDSSPFIGVHIRRGDFKHVGLSIPLEWYDRAIKHAMENMQCNNFNANNLEIRIFTDDVLGVENYFTNRHSRLTIMPNTSALQDLLMLSKAAILIGTSRSTFSMWAVFLGQMPSI